MGDLLRPRYIFVHCSDSKFGCVRLIKKWHIEENGWRDIGYHNVIMNGYPGYTYLKSDMRLSALDGSVECGRFLDANNVIGNGDKARGGEDGSETGAHVYGWNGLSIGVCLIGVNRFTERQLVSLRRLCLDYTRQFELPVDAVLGHCEAPEPYAKFAHAQCPGLGMSELRAFIKGGSEDPRPLLGRWMEQPAGG